MTVVRKGGALATLTAALEALDNQEARVGWFESARYPDGTPVAYVATIHEFGTSDGHVPSRPFMRPAVADNGPEWMEQLGAGARAALQGSTSPSAVLEVVAAKAAGDVAKKIAAVTSPTLAPATVRRKGSTKPLVDTGQMIQSVTYRVGAP